MHTLAHFRLIDKPINERPVTHMQWLFICGGKQWPQPGQGVTLRPCECTSFQIKEVGADGKSQER
jgi:hypothetical protein